MATWPNRSPDATVEEGRTGGYQTTPANSAAPAWWDNDESTGGPTYDEYTGSSGTTDTYYLGSAVYEDVPGEYCDGAYGTWESAFEHNIRVYTEFVDGTERQLSKGETTWPNLHRIERYRVEVTNTDSGSLNGAAGQNQIHELHPHVPSLGFHAHGVQG